MGAQGKDGTTRWDGIDGDGSHCSVDTYIYIHMCTCARMQRHVRTGDMSAGTA